MSNLHALVPFIIPVGWGLGYAVTTGIKTLLDYCLPGKDQGVSQDSQDDLIWRSASADAKGQTNPAGKVCSKPTDVCETVDEDPTVNGTVWRLVFEQINPAGKVCSKPTDVCETADEFLTIQDKVYGIKVYGTGFEETDPAGEVSSECPRLAAEQSTPDWEDLSAADLAKKTFAELTAEALASVVPTLVLPERPSRSFDVPSSPARRLVSKAKGNLPKSQHGDSFTQFRFAEEKDWEMDPFAANQVSAVLLDLPALAQSLQQVPLHRRLNLEAELVQVSTPVELPAVSLAPKQEVPKLPPPSAAFKGLSSSQKPVVRLNSQVSSVAVKPEEEEEDGDEELDELLGLQKPGSDDAGHQLICSPNEERQSPEKGFEEAASEENALDEDVAPPKPAEVKGSMTEDDLEDWLDSMIS